MTQNYEEFTEQQVKILENFVSNATSNVFILKNLPEVIKGALFSRYSRSTLGLRSLLLKEFILNEDTSFSSIVGTSKEEEKILDEQLTAVQKAQNFYDRVLDGYGDDSIGELGGAHLAIENISMIAAKNIEDSRIGGSPLEKSTRYIYFDQKVKGEYLFYKEPVLMTSAYRDLYLEICTLLFETYNKLIPPLTAIIEQKFPREPEISKSAYTAALRAKVLDCLRGLLPASSLTNVGLFGNGRFYEYLLQKMQTHNLTEIQEIGKESYTELAKTIPSFVRRAETSNKHFQAYAAFIEQMNEDLKKLAQTHLPQNIQPENLSKVNLIHFNKKDVYKVAAALLYKNSKCNLQDLENYCQEMAPEELLRILDAASSVRENRRHKSPRALELASFTFEITADFGIYRDLQRHRMLTQERQLITCDHGYFIPSEIQGTEMEKEYKEAMDRAKKAYDTIVKELPEEAQYIVPMAYNMKWFFHINLRSLQWLCELRSSPAGHPSYRLVAQEMVKQVSAAIPEFTRFFKFVNFDGYDLGRLNQEVKKVEKLESLEK